MTTMTDTSLYSANVRSTNFGVQTAHAINVQPNQSLLFLYRLQKAFKNNDCPVNGPCLILEKAFGRYIPEENIFYELHLMTGDSDFAHKMNSLYETFYKMNPVFRNCALQYIDEAIERQAPLN